ncbi:MAG: hypothetical protein SOU88_08785 [Candidatus Treponema excrementipullorum]|nr:hypothetical protein [Candidatus Treponema excrementipullorum]
MKKLRTTLFVCLTALAVLTAFGCKQEAANTGDDPKAWKYQKDIEMVDGKNVIQIEYDSKTPIEWAAVFDENNVLVELNGKTLPAPSKAVETTTLIRQFTVPKEGKYNVYIYQPKATLKVNKEEKTADGANVDFRGYVQVKAQKGVRVQASNYREYVDHVACVAIENNESYTSGKNWNGDYGVKKVTPARLVGTDKWEAVQNYEAKVEEGYLVPEKETKKVLVPSGKYLIAVNQPDRLKNVSDEDIKKHIEENWKDKNFPGQIGSDKTSQENIAAYRKYQNEAYWVGTTYDVGVHSTDIVVKTGSNTKYLSPDNTIQDTGKNVAPTLYEVVEVPAGEK